MSADSPFDELIILTHSRAKSSEFLQGRGILRRDGRGVRDEGRGTRQVKGEKPGQPTRGTDYAAHVTRRSDACHRVARVASIQCKLCGNIQLRGVYIPAPDDPPESARTNSAVAPSFEE